MRLCFKLVLTLALIPVLGLAETTPARPNILWLVCEDFTASYSGPYGDPLARTPNFDRMAREGVTFDQAHSSAPVCAPARSSLITGCYASSLGTQNMRSTRPLPDGYGFFPQWLRQAGYFCTNNAKTDYNTSTRWGAAWDENGKQAHWRHRKPGQPFFSVFNFEMSHESRLHRRAQLETDPAKVRVPAYLPDTPEVRADIAQYFDCVSRADAALGRVLEELRADGLEENTIIFCYSDNGGAVSRSKRFLYDNGTHVALVVRVPAALRTWAAGAPGSRNAELVNFIDFAPTVLSLAGVPRPAQFQGRVLFGPDRAPAPPSMVLFRDRMDERYELSRAVTDGRFRYIRNYYPALPWGQHLDFLWRQASMRQWAQLAHDGKLNETQRAFFEPKPAEELFDCQTDPDNVRNLASDPAQQDNLRRLRAALRAHLLRTRDTGFMPEPMMIAMADGRSPAVVAADDARYPVARVVDLLDSLQLARSPDRKVVQSALADPLAVVRYWAAVSTWTRPGVAPLEPLLKDSETLVRLAAAESLLRERDNPAAWQAIEAALDQGPGEMRLYALNVMARVPRAWPATWLPRIEKLAAESDAGMENYIARAAETLVADAKRPAK